MLYTRQSIVLGVKDSGDLLQLTGIYPYSLPLQLASGGPGQHEAVFMDLLLIRAQGHEDLIITRLYDKGREACFASVHSLRYQHFSSCIAARARHTTISSQLHRFNGIINAANDLPGAAGRLIAELQRQGCDASTLLRISNSFCRRMRGTSRNCTVPSVL